MYQEKIMNSIIYLQNESDHHVELQMTPFLNMVKNKDHIKVIIGNWGIGHKAPPLDVIEKHLENYIFNDLFWMKT